MRIIRQAVVMKNLSCRAERDQKDTEDREDNSPDLARAEFRLRVLHFLSLWAVNNQEVVDVR